MKKPNAQTAKIAIDQDIRSAICYEASDYHSTQITRMLYEGLMRKNSSGKIVLAIAKSYEVSKDQKRYTFYLKNTVWSNGDLVTAHDFAYTWKKLIDPKSALPLACDFHLIKNAKQCSEGKMPLDQVAIFALDDATLVVELENPNPYFLAFVASPSYFPVNAKIDASLKLKFTYPVTNGPFLLKEWKPTYSLLVAKNPTYWDAQNVKLDAIDIQIIPDSITQLYLYDQKKLDYIGSPLSMFIAADSLKGRDDVNKKETSAVACLMINTEKPPLTHKKLRQALSLALNRSDIAHHVIQLGAIPATGFLSGCLKLSHQGPLEDNNKSKAKELFKEALKELKLSEKTFPTITLSYRNLPEAARVMAAIKQQWKEVLGVHIELKSSDAKAHMSDLFSGNYQIGEVTWSSKVEDPSYLLSFFKGKSLRMNLPRWECKAYNELLDAIAKEVDQDQRIELLKKAEGMFIEEMPIIPIYFTEGLWLKNPALKKVFVSRLKTVDFKGAHFSPLLN